MFLTQPPQAVIAEPPKVRTVRTIGLQKRGIQEQHSTGLEDVMRLLDDALRVFAILQDCRQHHGVEALFRKMTLQLVRIADDIDPGTRDNIQIDRVRAETDILRPDIENPAGEQPMPL